MDSFIINHINKLHQEGLSEEGIKSLNILESEIGVLSAELEEIKKERREEVFLERYLIEKFG